MATVLEENEVVIQDIGAIEKLAIKIPAEGGVVVLKGRNGSGKSTALKAAEALVSGERPPGPRDGRTKGYVEGFGVSLTVGRQTKRDGELVVQGFDGKFDLSKLVDPGLKDTTAADLARIRALLFLTGTEADASLFEKLAGGPEALHAAVSVEDLRCDDLCEMAGKVKRGFERLAREAEKAHDHEISAADALRTQSDEADVEQFPPEAEMQEAFREACEHRATLQQRQRNAEKSSADREKFTEDLAAAKASLERAGSVAAIRAQIDARNQQLKANELRIAALQNEIATLKDAQRDIERERNGFAFELTAAETSAQLVESLESSLRGLAAEAPPTTEEMAAADKAVQDAQGRIERYGATKKLREAWAKSREHREKAKQHEARAKQLRDIAGGCEGVLTDAVARSGAPLRVVVRDRETRLVLNTKRGAETPFAELSEGERWKLAIDVATTCLPNHAVFFICQEGWEALDPINRRAVAQHARSLGVTILAAEASDDPTVTATTFDVN